jgi:hypothetical protein
VIIVMKKKKKRSRKRNQTCKLEHASSFSPSADIGYTSTRETALLTLQHSS